MAAKSAQISCPAGRRTGRDLPTSASAGPFPIFTGFLIPLKFCLYDLDDIVRADKGFVRLNDLAYGVEIEYIRHIQVERSTGLGYHREKCLGALPFRLLGIHSLIGRDHKFVKTSSRIRIGCRPDTHADTGDVIADW